MLRALTLWRPWPELILAGIKPVENRSWSTGHRGELALHAGQRYDRRAILLLRALGYHVHPAGWLQLPDETIVDCSPASPTGLVGLVTLAGICGAAVPSTQPPLGPSLAGCACGPFAAPELYHWQITDPRRAATPVPARGFQQLWQVPAGTERVLRARRAGASQPGRTGLRG